MKEDKDYETVFDSEKKELESDYKKRNSKQFVDHQKIKLFKSDFIKIIKCPFFQ